VTRTDLDNRAIAHIAERVDDRVPRRIVNQKVLAKLGCAHQMGFFMLGQSASRFVGRPRAKRILRCPGVS
jgi:hypothetical protein